MADNSSRPSPSSGRLDASGPREVVYCHQCHNEWYQDEGGLRCPRCEGEVTEIVTADSDPRPVRNARPPTPPGFISLRNHNPWPEDDNSDPEEADIEEHITRGPGNSVFISRTIRSGPNNPLNARRRRHGPNGPNDPDNVMRDFQQMVGTLMGPGFRPGPPGRSGQDDLFPGPFGGLGGAGGRHVLGGTFTYTTGLRPRNADGPQDGRPPVDDLATILSSIFGPTPGEGPGEGRAGMPPGLPGLFASLLNPANARRGDAVYSQEALDQIISTLMEQHPTSNAPGPASPDAIQALPKIKLDEKLLGPEGKGECSVCMDDVHIGDEVVSLPCSHWFHEQCAGAWLSEHNTCPICRKGIEDEAPPPTSRRSSQNSTPTSRPDHRSRRLSLAGHLSRDNTASRNEARLQSIRNSAMLSPQDADEPRRYDVRESLRDIRGSDGEEYSRRMPGSFRRRDSEMSIDGQRDSRRGNTSGSDRSRESRRSSHSGNNGGSSSSGPMSWLRDRWGGRRHD